MPESTVSRPSQAPPGTRACAGDDGHNQVLPGFQAQPAKVAPKPPTTAIERPLPHRYLFLLIDRAIDFEPQKRVQVYKNITPQRAVLRRHLPDHR